MGNKSFIISFLEVIKHN